jgi:tight adherence protein C
MLVVALACGAGIGLAAWLAIRGFMPARSSLAAALDDLEHPRATPPTVTSEPSSQAITSVLGPRVARVAGALGFEADRRLTADLELIGRSWERHVLDKVLAAIYGFVLPLVVWVLMGAAGVQLPVGVAVIAAALGVGAGFVLPDVVLRAQVAERRASFNHAFALYLELVSLVLAGGGGIETSLLRAADTGEGWAFQQLRAALTAARLTGRTPWEAFEDLGARLRLPALSDLAASVTLAGEQGAKVRASLAAKAAAIRTRQLADAETTAQAATERMSLPLVLLFGGFLLLIGFPAVVHVLTGI